MFILSLSNEEEIPHLHEEVRNIFSPLDKRGWGRDYISHPHSHPIFRPISSNINIFSIILKKKKLQKS